MGIGKQLTPKAFVNACNVFIYTENLLPKETKSRGRKIEIKATTKKDQPPKLDPLPLIKGAFDMAIQEDGWSSLATMGFYLHQLDPGFDPRTYGFKQLSQLIKSYEKLFELKFKEESGTTSVCVRLKE